MGAAHLAAPDAALEAVDSPMRARPPAARPATGSATGGPAARRENADPPPPLQLELDGMPVGEVVGRAGPQLDPRGLLGLQRTAGNQAVLAVLGPVAQRVPLTVSGSETLYNQEGAGGTAGAKAYGGNKTFDLSRTDDSSVTATVRVRFLAQSRCSDPAAPGVPPGTKEGQLYGPRTEIPEGEMKKWAESTLDAAMEKWQNRLTLVGEEPGENGAPPTKKRLPVTFTAVKLFGASDEADSTVIIHPPTVTAGGPGQPIDAGNFYMKKDDRVYPANDAVIYAHEYGHLIGIPDEYSQSNAQMNALLHQAAPGNAASSMAALDKETIRLMALASLQAPLLAQLDAAMAPVIATLRAARPLVKAKMSRAAREGAASSAVRQELVSLLKGTSEAKVAPAAPTAAAFETTANFSNRTIAARGVEAGFSAGSLGRQIHDAYESALNAPQEQAVDVTGLGKVRIEVSTSVSKTSAAGAPQAGNAGAVATAKVGPAAAPGLPTPAPSGTLVEKLTSLPATWAAAGSTLEASVTAAAFSAAMADAIKSIGAAVEVAERQGTGPKKADSVRLLYQRALNVTTIAAERAAEQVATDLVATAITPTLNGSVTELQGQISAEVERAVSATPSSLAAQPPDPAMAAIVGAMKAQLDADKKATEGSGRDPLHQPGGTAADQSVTYSYEGLMGSNRSVALRADQFGPIVAGFNAKLRKPTEKDFTAEVK